MADKFKLKKTVTAKILDRDCDVYSMEFDKAKLKGPFYIWKGMPLKTESEVSVMKVLMEATKIDRTLLSAPISLLCLRILFLVKVPNYLSKFFVSLQTQGADRF